jgi:hypothetical protein
MAHGGYRWRESCSAGENAAWRIADGDDSSPPPPSSKKAQPARPAHPTSTAGSSSMDARAEAPAPPKTSVYLPAEDLPPKREKSRAGPLPKEGLGRRFKGGRRGAPLGCLGAAPSPLCNLSSSDKLSERGRDGHGSGISRQSSDGMSKMKSAASQTDFTREPKNDQPSCC